MIQLNLLPDVKREYLKAQQTKYTVIVVAVIGSLAALAFVGVLFSYVRIIQPRHKAHLQADIDQSIQNLENYEDATKMVTTQGVLEQIGPLQDKKFITSRLFGYVTSFTPQNVAYNNIDLDLSLNTLRISGGTTTYEKANELANNLKSAKFTYIENETEQTVTPFTSVVFTSLSSAESSTDGYPVRFEISFQIDAKMFDQAIKDGKLSVDASSEKLLLPDDIPFTSVAPTQAEQDITNALGGTR